MPARASQSPRRCACAAAARSHAALLPTLWNQLLTGYSAATLPGFGLAAARRVFDEIPRPDAISWNAHVAAGAHPDAWRLLRAVHARGLAASTFALASALRSAVSPRSAPSCSRSPSSPASPTTSSPLARSSTFTRDVTA
uniref:Uncharacterized protein n=1 Tax=Setaria viridis TaxID=4556 RepID=A0A4U6U6F1_SETVI|nr:hypothetical protein SEVIR_6G102057v2 [Setaria viridis]